MKEKEFDVPLLISEIVFLVIYAPLLFILVFNCWNYIIKDWREACFQNKLIYFISIVAVSMRIIQVIEMIIWGQNDYQPDLYVGAWWKFGRMSSFLNLGFQLSECGSFFMMLIYLEMCIHLDSQKGVLNQDQQSVVETRLGEKAEKRRKISNIAILIFFTIGAGIFTTLEIIEAMESNIKNLILIVDGIFALFFGIVFILMLYLTIQLYKKLHEIENKDKLVAQTTQIKIIGVTFMIATFFQIGMNLSNVIWHHSIWFKQNHSEKPINFYYALGMFAYYFITQWIPLMTIAIIHHKTFRHNNQEIVVEYEESERVNDMIEQLKKINIDSEVSDSERGYETCFLYNESMFIKSEVMDESVMHESDSEIDSPIGSEAKKQLPQRKDSSKMKVTSIRKTKPQSKQHNFQGLNQDQKNEMRRLSTIQQQRQSQQVILNKTQSSALTKMPQSFRQSLRSVFKSGILTSDNSAQRSETNLSMKKLGLMINKDSQKSSLQTITSINRLVIDEQPEFSSDSE